MKHVFYAIMLLGMMLTTASCSEEAFQTPGTEQSAKGEKVTFTVSLPGNDSQNNKNHSRIAFDDETLQLTWQEGDQLILQSTTYNEITLSNLISGAGTTTAQFPAEFVHDNYKFFYGPKHLDRWNHLTPNYIGQKQTGNNNTDHLRHYLLLSTGDKEVMGGDIMDGHFTLEHKSSVFRFDIDSYPTEIGNLQQIIWTSNYGTKEEGDLYLDLDLTAETSNSQKVVAYMVFDPARMKQHAGKDIALTLVGDKGTRVATTTSAAGKEYLPGHRYNATVTTNPNQPNALNQWAEVIRPKSNQLLLVTNNGKVEMNKDCSFKQIQRIGESNKFLVWNDEKPITALENNLFREVNNLVEVQLPNKLETIGDFCFTGCSSLTNVILPTSGSLKTIGSYAFALTNITTLKLPDSVESLGVSVFQYNNSLTSLHIPDKITTLPSNCCVGCEFLTTLTGCKGVTTIKEKAFYGCNKLTSYPSPETLTTIEDWAFASCQALTHFRGLGAAKLGHSVFAFSGLTEFTIPENLTLIKAGNKPLIEAEYLTKLIITAAKDDAVKIIPEVNEFNAQPGNIDLYILKDWASKTGNLKADVANKTWYDRTWKSITLIEKDGKPVVE